MFTNPTNIPTNGLVLDLPLDGNANARVGSNWTPTNIDWVSAYKGYVSEVARFNNTTSNINLWTNITEINQVFNWWWSIATCFKLDSYSTTHRIIDCNESPNVWYLLSAYDESWWLYRMFFSHKFSSNGWNWYSDRVLELWKDYDIEIAYDNSSDTNVPKMFIDWIEVALIEDSKPSGIAWNSTWACFIWNNYNLNRSWNWTIWLVKIYNKTLSEREIHNLTLEVFRKLWPFHSLQYPELFEWCVWYWDFRWWDISNLITWEKLTIWWSPTQVTDHLWISNNAYSFDWIDDYFWTWIVLEDWDTIEAMINIVNLWDFQCRMIDVDTWTTNNQIWVYYKAEEQAIVMFVYNSSWFNTACQYVISSTWWYHVVAQFKNWDWKLIVNNNTPVTSTATFTFPTSLNWINLWASLDTSPWYNNWEISYLKIHKNKQFNDWEIWLLYKLSQEKYIYQFPKYTPASLPKPVLHIDWTTDWTTFYDKSWNWNHGTQSGWVSTGRIGQHKYMSFDWSDDYINSNYIIPNWTTAWLYLVFDFKTSYTWVQSLIWNYWRTSNANHFETVFNVWLVLNFWLDDWTSYSWTAIDISRYLDWKIHRIYFHRDRSRRKVYIDWVKIYDEVYTWNVNLWERAIDIWRRKTLNDRYLNWDLLNIKFLDEWLSDKQAEEDYYANFIAS